MSGESITGATFPQIFEGTASKDAFFPLPDLRASLIPPVDALVPFDHSGSENGVVDGRMGGDSYFAGPQEHSSGIEEGGGQGHDSFNDDVSSQELRSSVAGDGAQEGVLSKDFAMALTATVHKKGAAVSAVAPTKICRVASPATSPQN